MRYKIQLRVREDTGEVEFFQVDTVGADPNAAGHNAAHQRFAEEVAGVLDTDAEVEELYPHGAVRAASERASRQTPEAPPTRPAETHDA